MTHGKVYSMRFLLAIALSGVALTGCGYVKNAQTEATTQMSQAVRDGFKSAFLDACAKNGTFGKKTCGCMQTQLQKKLTDDQLLRLTVDENSTTKELQAAYMACRGKST